MKAIVHAISDDNVPGLQHLLGSLSNYDVNQPNKVCFSPARVDGGPGDRETPLLLFAPFPSEPPRGGKNHFRLVMRGSNMALLPRGPSFTLQLLQMAIRPLIVTPKEEGLLVPGSSVSFRTWGGVGDSGETLGFAWPPDLKTPSFFLLFSLSVPARDPSLTHRCRLREYSDAAVAHQERLQNRRPGQGMVLSSEMGSCPNVFPSV
jgi:hypothetical protein